MTKAELESVLSTYNTLMAWATIAVAVGILGEYVNHFLFSKEKKGRAELGLTIFFGLCVFGGVIGEWKYGEKLSQTTYSLQRIADREVAEAQRDIAESNVRAKEAVAKASTAQARIVEAEARAIEASLELAKFRSPRTLDRSQKDRIIAKLSRFKGTPFNVGASSFDPPEGFTNVLSKLLESAGWINAPSGNRGPAMPETGLVIRFDSGSRNKLEAPGRALASALVAEGITDAILKMDEDRQSTEPLFINIGRKQ